jgi:hypothetical protein
MQKAREVVLNRRTFWMIWSLESKNRDNFWNESWSVRVFVFSELVF